ncbi:MAG TPA: helix-turn-helix transcriptional regulator [Puia sp.]
MNNDKKPRKYSSPLIHKILGEITPVQKGQTQTKMTLAANLDDLITARGWGKSEFADKVNKNPSEITKWLSGTHNFTIDTLAEIAVALNMPVVELFAPAPMQVVNKVHMEIVVKDVPQSIPYLTPFAAVRDRMINFYTGIYRGGILPLTARTSE